MAAAKEISRKQRAASAGFIMLCPSPPNSCLTTRMANTPPSAGIHSGIPTGILTARITPVTTADRSPTVTGSFISFSYTSSVSTQDAMQTAITASARQPKAYTPIAHAGSNASATSRMMAVVLAPERTCGETDTWIRGVSFPGTEPDAVSFLIVVSVLICRRLPSVQSDWISQPPSAPG